MKFMIVVYASIIFFLVSCIEQPTKKIFIKSAEDTKGARIDWYVYSKITSFAPDYLQTSTDDKKPFFKSFFLTDIHFRNDSLFISLSDNKYDMDKSRLRGIEIIIDTLGESWNSATSRFGRLRRRGVNTDEPHFIDTYCAKGECE